MAVVRPEMDGAAFVWLDEAMASEWSTVRAPATPDDIRPIEDIALEELRAVMAECGSDDPEIEAARRLGIRRLTAASRERLHRAAPIRGHFGS